MRNHIDRHGLPSALLIVLLSLITAASAFAEFTKEEATELWQNVYLPAESREVWAGDKNNHYISDFHLQNTLSRVNYFRIMTGLPGDLTLVPSLNQKCAQTAYMMQLNEKISHLPTPDWKGYTAEGAEAAANSNLALSIFTSELGPELMTMLMADYGPNTQAVGHRRWILYPALKRVGIGLALTYFGSSNVSPSAKGVNAAALWVIAANTELGQTWGERPSSPKFVAWPPPGYVPAAVIFARWSFSPNESRGQADLSDATVTMTRNGQPVQVNMLPYSTDYGDNTLVWEPLSANPSTNGSETDYVIHISGKWAESQGSDFSYTVRAFNPQTAGGGPSPTPFPTPTPVVSAPPIISGAKIVSGVVGGGFSYKPTATNSPNGFLIQGTLPKGLLFTTINGRIHGTPRVAGVSTVQIRARNIKGLSNPLTVKIKITKLAPTPTPKPKPTRTPTPTPTKRPLATARPVTAPPILSSPGAVSGTVGKAFSFKPLAKNSPASFAIKGALPKGLVFSTTNGKISGVPQVAVVKTIAIVAKNRKGLSNQIRVTIRIAAK